ncbi:hypothetical protein [Rummeliibacillus sp. POC4]|uniref:hypothetical protein n=1 Tax=Rummeliibacillus sp. POC4 TaxID=2305899 RepID=UPI001314D453|nr:hypothetical protein [Rummeliibacillus sp. POC4]
MTVSKKQHNIHKKIEQLGFDDDTIHARLTAKQRMFQNRSGSNRVRVPTKPKWIRSLGFIVFILLMCGLVIVAISLLL